MIKGRVERDSDAASDRRALEAIRAVASKDASTKSSGYLKLLLTTGGGKFDFFLLGIGTFAAIAAGLPFPFLGILFGELVDDLNSATCDTSSSSSLSTFDSSVSTKVLYVLYVSIANFCLIYTYTGAWSLFGERLVRRLRVRYLSALLRQELSFFDALSAGDVATRLDADLQAIQTGTSEKVGLYIASVSYFVTAYVIAFLKSPKLAGMLVSVVPAFLLMAMGGGHFGKKYQERISDRIAKATGLASAGLSNMMIVHAFGAHKKLEALFSAQLGVARADGIKKAIVSAIQIGLLYLIAYSANALAFWQGSREIAASLEGDGNGVSVGAVYTVIFILIDASFIISQVAPFLQLFASAVAAFEKLVPTMRRTSKIDGTSETGGRILDAVDGSVRFENVSFSYPSRRKMTVLQDFSLMIPAKKHTAIVGMSGSGKSTVAALITRLYDPDAGAVFLDEENMRGLNTRSVRRFIGTVEQNGRLFDRSILENIAHGLINSPLTTHARLQSTLLGSALSTFVESVRSGNSFDDAVVTAGKDIQEIVTLVRAAAQEANASYFIDKLEHGLVTSVGPCGNQLSGGQRQRIVLARALIRQPAILILDEATASLDSVSERAIQEALENITTTRTTITIAHRLSTIKSADNIVVMTAGQIVEQGTYSDLIAKDGIFAGMIGMQNLNSKQRSESMSGSSTDSASIKSVPSKGVVTVEKQIVETSNNYSDPNIEAGDELIVPPKRGAVSSVIGVIAMARPYLVFVLLGLAGAIVVGGSHSAEAVVFGQTLGSLSSCRLPDEIRSSGALFGLLFFILAIVAFLANVLSTSAFGTIAERLLYKVRVLSLRSLFSQDLQWHESSGRTPSSLLSYISSDATSLSGITGTVLGVILAILINMVAGIVLAHVIAWKIAIVLLATVPILLASGFLRLRVLAQFHERHQKAFAHSVGIATEAVSSIKSIATFTLESEILQFYQRSLSGPYQATLKSLAYGNFWLAMAYSISNLVYALAYWWGAKQIMAGTYTQTQFFIVLPALLFSAQACGQMFSLAPDVAKASIAAGRVLDLIETGPQNSSDLGRSPLEEDLESANGLPEKTPARNHGATVSFRNVSFSYPSRPHVNVLQGLSFTANANSFVALVGPSGAGKSTIIALLERFYSPASGAICIDGRDISKSFSVSFRQDVGLVPQESVLFEGTVRFNIALGARENVEPTQDDIEQACKAANLHDTIMALPEGYNTPCGVTGSQFSGGQMQKLSIARALVRKPRLLLLDEPTSALDAESERSIQEVLERTAGGVTVIVIAHRLHTIRRADVIYLIEEGRCVDSGKHEELFERSAMYRENASHQTLG